MILLRSLAYNVFFFSWLTVLLTSFWIFLPFPRGVLRWAIRWWSRITAAALRILGGVDARYVGLERIPDGPVLIACKHQSIWETFIFFLLVEDPQYVLKKELTEIPFWGWYATKLDHVAVDRSAGARALKDMVAACVDRLKQGRQVVIFPQGTRVAPGVEAHYHPGVAAIYQKLPDGVPVVPVALNSGRHWGRRKFIIKPGTITLEVLEPIMPGLPRKEFMKALETRIEDASTRLLETG